ncbi:hypothetical protein XELAEV_18035536mg [Xenopus laevis]|uniref:5-hydroxytryptamine receptor 3A n=1 Tax=Xenopus laevis TaxID=8355 RepID=A0A974HCJ6_XENLA|nr:hypothetical protein XELAEV_18035536mg [Xenopus laevis]
MAYVAFNYKCHTANVNRSSKPALLRLSDHLMEGYKKGVRPVQNWRQTTTVYIDVMVYAILGVDEKNQVLTTYIWYRQFWVDEFLTWDPKEFENVSQISIPTEKIWVPDILINELRPLFYAVNLLLPSMFLMVMDIIGFYLPPDSGERVSFKITLLLGYSVFLIIVSDTLPATAIGTPLIGVYFVVCMALLVISLTETILIVRLVHKQDLQPHVPEWLRILVLEKITVLLCIRDKKKFGAVRVHSSDISHQMENSSTAKLAHYSTEYPKDYERSAGVVAPSKGNSLVADNILHEIASIRQYLEKRDQCRDIAKEWLQVGYVLDILLFRIYLVAVLAYTVTMATMWSYWQQA